MSDAWDRRQAAEELALVLAEGGMQRMTARVLTAFLFTESATLTQGEIATELGASAGSVSGALKALSMVGLLERVVAADSRRAHHRLREDAWSRLFARHNGVVEAMREAARVGAASTEPDSHAGRRLRDMYDFYVFLGEEIPALLERWERRPRD